MRIGFFITVGLIAGLVGLGLGVYAQQPVREPIDGFSFSCDLDDGDGCGGELFGMTLVGGEGIVPENENAWLKFDLLDDADQRVHVASGQVQFDVRGLGGRNFEEGAQLLRLGTPTSVSADAERFSAEITRRSGYVLPDVTIDPERPIDSPEEQTGRVVGNSLYSEGLLCAPKGPVNTEFDTGWFRVTYSWENEDVVVRIEDVDGSGEGRVWETVDRGDEVNRTNFAPKKGLSLVLGAGIDTANQSLGNGFFSSAASVSYRNLSVSLGSLPEITRTVDVCPDEEVVSPYSYLSCQDPQVTEDRPFEQALEVEDPPRQVVDVDLSITGGGDVDFKFEELFPLIRGAVQNPIVRFEPIPAAPQPGEDVEYLADQRYYTASQNEGVAPYTTWCVNGKTQQGVVAGGGVTVETVPGSPVGPCCNPVTRTPEVDVDNDGLDDNWEEFYFVGKTIDGVTYSSIEDVRPEDDPDDDGYRAVDFLKADSPRGIPVTIAPGSVFFVPGGEPQVFVTGDGSLTNAEEFLWDLNPLSADTDGDGVQDEADLVGVGQGNFEFEAPDVLLGRDEVRVTTLGVASNKGLIKIDSYAREVIAGRGGVMEVELSHNGGSVPSEGLVFEADISELIVSRSSLSYEWFVNDVRLPSTYQGLGRWQLVIDDELLEDLDVGADVAEIVVGVNVTERIADEFGRQGSEELRVELSNSGNILYTPDCVVDGGACPVRNSLLEFEFVPGAGPDFSNSDRVRNVLVGSTARWRVDGGIVDEFVVEELPIRSVYAVSSRGGDSHDIELEVLGPRGNIVVDASAVVDIREPGVELVADAGEWVSEGVLEVPVGERVNLMASAVNFQEGADVVDFIWDVNGLGVENEMVVNDDEMIFTAEFVGDRYEISVRGDYLARSDEFVDEVAQRTIRVRVVDVNSGADSAAEEQADGGGLFASIWSVLRGVLR